MAGEGGEFQGYISASRAYLGTYRAQKNAEYSWVAYMAKDGGQILILNLGPRELPDCPFIYLCLYTLVLMGTWSHIH